MSLIGWLITGLYEINTAGDWTEAQIRNKTTTSFTLGLFIKCVSEAVSYFIFSSSYLLGHQSTYPQGKLLIATKIQKLFPGLRTFLCVSACILVEI